MYAFDSLSQNANPQVPILVVNTVFQWQPMAARCSSRPRLKFNHSGTISIRNIGSINWSVIHGGGPRTRNGILA